VNKERVPIGESDDVVSPPRREFLAQMLGVFAGAALPSFASEAWAEEVESRYEERGWFYDSMEEIANIYDQEYYGEEQLKNIIRREGGELRGVYNTFEYTIPPVFIEEVCRHCSTMLDVGAAQYLFRLDAFHNHLYLPKEIAAREYRGLSDKAAVAQVFTDKRLAALYHNYEHLKFPSPGTPLLERFKKRNVVGFFDGRPLEVLPFPSDKSIKVDLPMQNMTPYVKFAAHKDGLFSITRKGETVRLDVSLDDPRYY
jgi:hypothetical protein